MSDELANSNSLETIKRLVLGEFLVRSHEMPAKPTIDQLGTKSHVDANREFNDFVDAGEDDKSEEPDVIEIQNQAANYA